MWLGLACATGVRAMDIVGVDKARLHVTPPEGYCLIGPSDVRYARLRDGYDQVTGWGQLQAIFAACTPPGRVRPVKPDRAGFISTLPQNPALRASDLRRSEWLKQVALPRATPLTEVGEDLSDGAARYFHVIRTPRDNASADTRIEATADTIIKNTPVEITVVRYVAYDDVAGGATALEEARALLRATMTRFGGQNGVDFEHVVTDAQARSALALEVAAFVDVAGAILMITLAVRSLWIQVAVGPALAIAGVLIYRAAPGAGTLFKAPALDLALWAGAAVLFVGLANGVWLILDLIPIRGVGLTRRLRAAISARSWGGAEDATADFTKRWFVCVAAATGGVVFAMLGREGFLEELGAAFGPSRIVFTLLITVVSVTLIGPVEDFIFDSRIATRRAAATPAPAAHAEEASRFEQLLGLASPRALGRFALVMAFMLMITVMHGAIEARVHDSKGEDITTMLVASVGPAIITYYWCAALQHGVASVARRAGVAAALAGVLTLGIPGAMVTIADAASLMMAPMSWWEGNHTVQAWGMLLVGAPLDLAIGLVSFGVLAFGGGAVIDVARRRHLSPMVTVAVIGAALIGLVALFQLIAVGVVAALGEGVGAERYVAAKSELLGVAGWVVGLIVSGFPTVLRSGAQHARGVAQAPAADRSAGG